MLVSVEVDMIENFDALEMLKIHGVVRCLEVDANILHIKVSIFTFILPK